MAIDAVLADLTAGPPMDRLVCGDVGFGKTEVAIRAAFLTALAGSARRRTASMPSLTWPPRMPSTTMRMSGQARLSTVSPQTVYSR